MWQANDMRGLAKQPVKREAAVFRRSVARSAVVGSWCALTFGMMGCTSFHAEPPVAELRDRIVPPAAVLEGPASGEIPVPSTPDTAEQELQTPCGHDPAMPLTLGNAIRIGLELNPGLEVMRERVTQAEAGRQITFAEFLPQAKATFRHIDGTHGSPFALPTLPTYVGNVAFGGTFDRFDIAELNLQWIFWDFGRTPGRYGQSVATVDIARLQYQRARQTVAYNVAAAYFSLLQTQATHRIAVEAVKRAESVLRDAQNYRKRGVAINNDVLRAEVLLDEMRLNLVKARTAQGVAVAALNQVLGINVSSPTLIVDLAEEPLFQMSLAECLQLAVDSRDEFRVVLTAIRSARLGTGVAEADFLPKVFVGGVAVHQVGDGSRNENLFAGGLNIEIGLFEGGRRLGKLRGAAADTRAALAQGKEVCDRIAYEVTVAHLGINDARQRIVLGRAATVQATENLRVVRSLFEQGDAKPTDIVDAELAMTRAQQNYSTAIYDYQTALARLAYAVGGTLPYELENSGGGICHE